MQQFKGDLGARVPGTDYEDVALAQLAGVLVVDHVRLDDALV